MLSKLHVTRSVRVITQLSAFHTSANQSEQFQTPSRYNNYKQNLNSTDFRVYPSRHSQTDKGLPIVNSALYFTDSRQKRLFHGTGPCLGRKPSWIESLKKSLPPEDIWKDFTPKALVKSLPPIDLWKGFSPKSFSGKDITEAAPKEYKPYLRLMRFDRPIGKMDLLET